MWPRHAAKMVSKGMSQLNLKLLNKIIKKNRGFDSTLDDLRNVVLDPSVLLCARIASHRARVGSVRVARLFQRPVRPPRPPD